MSRIKIGIARFSVLVMTMLLILTIVPNLCPVAEASGFGMDSNLKDAHASFLGEDLGDFSGYSVAGAGDVNGDGYDDILIGAYGSDDGGSHGGQTYLILGNPSGWSMDTDLSNADASFRGEYAGDRAGYSVAGAGDVNGDGYDDILIGAYADDDGGDLAGQTYLILGNSSGWSMDTNLSNSDASFLGENAGDYSGISVAGAGDVNGDGYDDILIGANENDEGGNGAGQTYLILGNLSGWSMDTDLSNADASFWGENLYDHSGRSVAGAGDVNGDGYDDILIGANWNDDGGNGAGQTYLILGKASGWSMDTNLSNADASFWGEDAVDRAGYSVAGAGDVNGDGYDDILIGAHGNGDGGTDAGQTYLILGKASGWSMDTDLSNADASFWGENLYQRSGISVAGAGDVNSDGYDDILIGAYADDDGGDLAGQTYLILGKALDWSMDTDLSDADASFWGEEEHDDSGWSVAGGGDVNGDGYDDILIGALGNDGGGTDAGQTYLIFYESNPPAPDGLSASLSKDGDSISLSWNTVDYWLNLTGFNIYRSANGQDYSLLTNVSNATTSYSDDSVDLGAVYWYKVTTTAGVMRESEWPVPLRIQNDLDTDLDGTGNTFDDDDDGDGVVDGQDDFPLDDTEWLDTDGDGTGNNADTDDDNDGVTDAEDAEPLNPLNVVEDRMAGLEATLADINTRLVNITEEVDDLEDALDTVNDTLDDMEEVMGQMNDTLGAVEGELDALSVLLDEMNDTIADILQRLQDQDVRDELEALNRTVKELVTETLSELRTDLTEMEQRILEVADNDTALLDRLNQMEDRIDVLEDQALDTNSKVDALQTDVDAFEDEQERTTEAVEASRTLDMAAIALMVIVLVMLVPLVLFVRGRAGGASGSTVGGGPGPEDEVGAGTGGRSSWEDDQDDHGDEAEENVKGRVVEDEGQEGLVEDEGQEGLVEDEGQEGLVEDEGQEGMKGMI